MRTPIIARIVMPMALSGLLAGSFTVRPRRPPSLTAPTSSFSWPMITAWMAWAVTARTTSRRPTLMRWPKAALRFDNAYCTPLCGPTRALFNTGRYGFRTGGLSNQTAGRPLPTEEPAIARMLKQAGYATGHCGKWRQVGASPGDWGFDEFITDPTASGWFWKTSYTKNGKEVQTDKEIYYPDVCHEFALDFIKRHRDQPFFFYYASHLVHGPILRTPDSKPGASAEQLYADNVSYLDKQLGRPRGARGQAGPAREDGHHLQPRTTAPPAPRARSRAAPSAGRRGACWIAARMCRSSPVGRAPRLRARCSRTWWISATCSRPSPSLPAARCRQGSRSTAAASLRNCAASRAPRASGSSSNWARIGMPAS